MTSISIAGIALLAVGADQDGGLETSNMGQSSAATFEREIDHGAVRVFALPIDSLHGTAEPYAALTVHRSRFCSYISRRISSMP